jgi:hypothetical protein
MVWLRRFVKENKATLYRRTSGTLAVSHMGLEDPTHALAPRQPAQTLRS